jgi:hypothetical protein
MQRLIKAALLPPRTKKSGLPLEMGWSVTKPAQRLGSENSRHRDLICDAAPS